MSIKLHRAQGSMGGPSDLRPCTINQFLVTPLRRKNEGVSKRITKPTDHRQIPLRGSVSRIRAKIIEIRKRIV